MAFSAPAASWRIANFGDNLSIILFPIRTLLLLEIGRLESPSSLVFSMKMKIGYFSNI
jgi:hypothetical protein